MRENYKTKAENKTIFSIYLVSYLLLFFIKVYTLEGKTKEGCEIQQIFLKRHHISKISLSSRSTSGTFEKMVKQVYLHTYTAAFQDMLRCLDYNKGSRTIYC